MNKLNQPTAIPEIEETSATNSDADPSTCDKCQTGRRWESGNRWRSTIKLCPLHAAAPALYEALKATIAAHCPDDKFFCGACTPARAALALANGQVASIAASASTADQDAVSE